jgi:hypothetical protein
MKTHMRPAAAAVMLVCLVAAGCDHPNTRPHDKARATAETFLESCARDRPEAAIDVLTEPLHDAFSRAGSPARACSRFLRVGDPTKDDAELLAAFRRASVGTVVVKGGLARATVAAPGGTRSKIDLGFSAGEWKVESPPRRG